MRRACIRCGGLLGIVICAGVLLAAPVSASEPPPLTDDNQIDGPGAPDDSGPAISPNCPITAQGQLGSDGLVYDAQVHNRMEVEAKDSISWVGYVDGFGPGAKGEERRIDGDVYIEIAGIDVKVGSWHKDSTTYGDAGTYSWDLPSVVKGIEVPVFGNHSEPGINCWGSGTVVVKGTSPLALVSVGLLVISLVGVGIALIPVGRP